MRVLVTSGATKIPIDDVRFISNFSQGGMALKFIDEFLKQGEEVYHFYAKYSKRFEQKWGYISAVFQTFDEYKDLVLDNAHSFDIILSAAAVSDYAPEKVTGKISSSKNDELIIKLVKLPKVLNLIRNKNPKCLLVGFKLLNELSLEAAEEQKKNGVDITLINLLGKPGYYYVFKDKIVFQTSNIADIVFFLRYHAKFKEATNVNL